MKNNCLFFLLFVLSTISSNAQSHVDFLKHGFRIGIYTHNQINKEYRDNNFSLNSKSSLNYEFGYLIRTNTPLFLEAGIGTGLNTIMYKISFTDVLKDFNYDDKISSYDVFYTKFPISIGYNLRVFNLPFQLKSGISFVFMKSGSIKTSIDNIDNTGVSTRYFSNKFDINPTEKVYKTAHFSLGYYQNI